MIRLGPETAGAIGFWLDLLGRELFLFALFWLVLGAIDEFAVDCLFGWLRWRRRRRTPVWAVSSPRRLAGPIAVLVPAWSEAAVIGTTMSCMLRDWPQPEMRLYIGCYRNDIPTIQAAMAAAGADSRVRIVIHDRAGPSTKADCLNRLYTALRDDEARAGGWFRGVVFQDAEDMVHPLALPAIDRALDRYDLVQLPVRPEPLPSSRWISGHYCDEFAEAHAKTMIVREALGAGLPGAGVGCAISRGMLERLAQARGSVAGAGPFAAEALTEDYELGLVVARLGGRCCFLRLRDRAGRLIATRSLFPGELGAAVRQKTRWIHGISLQGWDRLGWARRPADIWMAIRDRRGPLTALVLAAAYALLLVEALRLAVLPGSEPAYHSDPLLRVLLRLSLANLAWRAVFRGVFTAREYGLGEGLLAIARIPVANIIQIMAGRRALVTYLRTLAGARVVWDKTVHREHAAIVAGLAPALRETAA